MRASDLFASALTGASWAVSVASAARVHVPTRGSDKGELAAFDGIKNDPLDKLYIPPGLTALGSLPTLDEEEKETLGKLFEVAKGAKKVSDFQSVTLKVTPEQGSKLGRKLGLKVLNRLDKAPGQPVTIVVTFLTGIVKCAIRGQSAADAFECGKEAVRGLGDNMSVSLPKKCNNRLGQFEIPGTGWPAPCHDPNVKQHPQGNAAQRWVYRSFCKFFTSLRGSAWEEADRMRGKPTCDEKFPSDSKIAEKEADEATKARLEEAKTNLINFRQQVQEKVNAGGKVEQSDIEKAAELIARGGLPSFDGKDKEEAIDMAEWYLDDVKPPPPPESDKGDTPDSLPAWVTATEVEAREIPLDEAASKQAFELVGRTPNRDLFQEDSSLEGSEKCFSATGLDETRHGEDWDRIAAALGYIEPTMREKQRACKACAKQGGKWVLGCGSMAK